MITLLSCLWQGHTFVVGERPTPRTSPLVAEIGESFILGWSGYHWDVSSGQSLSELVVVAFLPAGNAFLNVMCLKMIYLLARVETLSETYLDKKSTASIIVGVSLRQ